MCVDRGREIMTVLCICIFVCVHMGGDTSSSLSWMDADV